MVYYKGAVTYKDFNQMSMTEIFNLKNNAEKINRALEKEQKKKSH